MTFAQKLITAREAAQLTQAEAAAELGLSRRALQLWESGKTVPPLCAQLGALAMLRRLAPLNPKTLP